MYELLRRIYVLFFTDRRLYSQKQFYKITKRKLMDKGYFVNTKFDDEYETIRYKELHFTNSELWINGCMICQYITPNQCVKLIKILRKAE